MSRTPPSWHWTCSTDGTSSSGIPAAGAYFNAVWRQLVQQVFNDVLDTSETYANGGDRYWGSHVRTLGRAE